MKKTFLATILALAGLSTTAWSMTYKDQDLLLAFRGADNDVVFNLGSVTNFLNKASGTIINVTNFNIDVVKSKNGDSLDGVQVILAASSSADTRTAYITDVDAADGALPARVASVGDQTSTIARIGTISANYSTGDTNYNASVHSSEGSYSRIIDLGSGQPAKWDGVLGFNAEIGMPAVLPFLQIQGYAYPVKLGAFSIDASGKLLFVAGSAALPVTAPNLITGPANVTYRQGQTVTFSVEATGSPLYIQWSLNDSIVQNETNKTFSFVATTNDVGYVSVTVGNQLASYTASADLILASLPAKPSIGFATFFNGTNSFSFATETGVIYTVVCSSVLTAPVSTWVVLGSPISGDGKPAVVTDPIAGRNTRFYAVKATLVTP